MFRRFGGDAIEKCNKLTGIGGDAFAGNDDANKIQRVGGGNRDELAAWLLIALSAQRVNRRAESELLSEKTAYEPPASNFPAIFEAAESDKQLTPLGEIGFAREKFAENDSVTAQKHPARGFECARTVMDLAREE